MHGQQYEHDRAQQDPHEPWADGKSHEPELHSPAVGVRVGGLPRPSQFLYTASPVDEYDHNNDPVAIRWYVLTLDRTVGRLVLPRFLSSHV